MRDILIASENIASAVHYGLIHNGHPTYEHLLNVVGRVYEYEPNPSDEIIAAAWLHDALKYTDTTSMEIGKTLSRRVARICELVTDPGGKIIGGGKRKGAIRAEVKAQLYKNFLAETDNSLRADAGFIKCVDRFVNQHFVISTQNLEKAKTYINELPEFMKVFGVALIGKQNRETLWTDLFNQYAMLNQLVSE